MPAEPGAPIRLLILGGTGEAASLAARLNATGGVSVVLSLAGRTRSPRLPEVPVRIGGFGGVEGLARHLRSERIDRLLDAAHPFAAQIAAHAASACSETGVDRLKLLRPAWTPRADDRWHVVPTVEAAAARAGSLGRRPFLSLGHKGLDLFLERFEGSCVLRTIEPPAAPVPAGAVVLTARGPFTVEGEAALLRRHGVDVLVTRNSGGGATYAKIEAARRLGLPVVVIDRPAPPAGPVTADPDEAFRWACAR